MRHLVLVACLLGCLPTRPLLRPPSWYREDATAADFTRDREDCVHQSARYLTFHGADGRARAPILETDGRRFERCMKGRGWSRESQLLSPVLPLRAR